MIQVRSVKATPAWKQTKDRLRDAIATAGQDTLTDGLALAQQISLSLVPVYGQGEAARWTGAQPFEPVGEAGDRNRTYNKISGDAFIAGVLATLYQQLAGEVPEPDPGALKSAVAEPVGVAMTPGRIVAGYASRAELDSRTAFGAKFLLPSPRDIIENKYGHHKLLWWDYAAKRWGTAVILVKSDGSVQPIDGFGSAQWGAGWRGKITGNVGSWADVEFGTEKSQWPDMGPDMLDNVVAAFVNRHGVTLAPMVKSGRGIAPHGYLAAGAAQVYQQFYATDAAQQAFLAGVRALA